MPQFIAHEVELYAFNFFRNYQDLSYEYQTLRQRLV